jgi:predicted NACHT family NTPase
MQANEKGLAGNLISIHDLERIIIGYLKTIEVSDARTIARLMINQLCIRNFILCYLGSDYYGFVHRAFLEYFCALEFLWQFEKTRTLTIEQMKSEVFGKHWQDELWHEVLRLIAGRIDSKFVGEILDYLIQQEDESGKFTNIFLASDCLLEVRNRSPIFKVSAKLLNQLKNLARYEVGYDYQLYGNDKTHLIHEVRTKAISAVSRVWRDDPDTLPWLKSLAQSDKDVVIQQLAKQEIGRGWKDEAEL